MITYEELRKKVHDGFSIPREKWVVRTELFERDITQSEWYKEWEKYIEKKNIKVPEPYHYVCLVCGESCTNWFGRKERLCFDCRQWADGYGQQNKTRNIFQEA